MQVKGSQIIELKHLNFMSSTYTFKVGKYLKYEKKIKQNIFPSQFQTIRIAIKIFNYFQI